MARTKKQVLQATARKQQLHLEAVERATKEGASTAETPPAKKGKTDNSSSLQLVQAPIELGKQLDPYDRPPGRPHKTASPRKLKSLLDQFNDKDTDTGKSNHEGSLYKKIILAPKKVKAVENQQSDKQSKKKEPLIPSFVNTDLTEDDNFKTTPISGPVNLKKTKLTARKSTNAFKKAEARELLESLARRETETVEQRGIDNNDHEELPPPLHTYCPETNEFYPPIVTPVCISEIDIDFDKVKFPMSFPKGKVYARKTMPSDGWQPTARKSLKSSTKPSRGCGRKSMVKTFKAKKTFPTCPLSLEDLELIKNYQPSSTPDLESLTVFPSVHEAVITLPKSEQLPVALVCIKDIYKAPESATGDTSSEIVTAKETSPAGKKTPSPRGRKLNRQHSPRRSTEKARSPRRSPKGERRSKNIFEQFQTEIKEDEGPKTRKLANSPGRKSTSQSVASTTFASAMKVLRSVSEKVDGRRKKSGKLVELSPRKRSPRRTSLHLEIPEPSGSFVSSPVKTSTSPRSPRSGRKFSEDTVRRRSGSASPRGDRRIRSPSIKLQDDNVVYVSLVKRERVSPKANSSELMLTLKRESPRECEKAKIEKSSSVVRELDFMEVCTNSQILKNLTDVASDEDRSLSGKSSLGRKIDLPVKSSSPVPSTSTVVTSDATGPDRNVTNKKSKELLDLISKVDSQIKNAVLPPLDSSHCPEDDESETSSLNTSHNSETFAQLIDQMETEASLSKMKDSVSRSQIPETDVDSVPAEVKCGELYRRLIGKVTDKPSIQPKSQEIKISERSQSATDGEQKEEEGHPISGKSDSCLLKKHLLSEIIPVSKILESTISKESNKDTVSVEHSQKCVSSGDSTLKSTTSKEEPSEGKRVPLWRKLYKTKEPLPLDILSKAEKISNVDKKSAFISDELENYLESSKNLSLTSQGTPEHIKEKPSPNLKEIASELKDLEPDFDEVEGVLFVSFASKDAMEAHIAVEKKNKWDKDANHLLGVSRLLAFEREKGANMDGDSPEGEQAKTKIQKFQNLRGQHMKWKKYKRMLREEFQNMKQAREKGEFYHCFRQPEKTSDITKIKGWKNKFVDKTDTDAGKLHWRTEERLMRNLEPDDLRALGIKKKRRKNVVFTRRKGTFKDVGYPVGRTSTFGQSGSPPEDGDNWQVMLGEYEEPLYENIGDGESDHSDEEMRAMDWSHSHEDDSLDFYEEHMDYHVRNKPYCYAKRIKLRREYAEVFSWTDDEMKIMKKLGGVRNRRKKSDIAVQLAGAKSPEMKKKLRVIKVKRSSYIPVSVVTTRMAIDAACALDFGEYKPIRPGTGYADNIMIKTMMPKKIQPTTLAGLKLLKKGKALLRAQKEKKGSMLKSGVPVEYLAKKRNLSGEDSADRSLEEDERHDGESKRSCDKPGCRYGCICHLCNDNQEELEPRPQESAVHTCNKEYCRLGCICDSLGAGQDTAASEQHCGKPECMIKCVCSKPERRHSIGASSGDHPDEGGISSDEIPSLIQDSDLSAEGPKLENEKPKEEDKSAAPKTWSRHAKGDKYSNLPRRESRHRVSKNLDAITRKAMMVYETSEVYCEQSGRRKKHGDEVSPAPRTSISKLFSPPSKQTKGPPAAKVAKRKHSASHEVLHISDDEDVGEMGSCARMSFYSSTRMSDKELSGDPTVVHIEKASDGSGTSSVCITPGNSRPSSPGLNNQDLGRKLAAVAQKNYGTSEPQAANTSEPPKRKVQRILPQDFVQSVWHTQMVCLKANPKPKDPKVKAGDAEGEEIKLLEFMANCNWDNAKPHILSRVAQCLSRGAYPEPRRMVIGDFIVEILPKADKSAVIPPELRDKLPNSMYSIRVKVMRKASERDIQKFQMKAAMAAAQIKQHRASLNKPRDSVSSQSCDSASKRVFQNTSFNALDMSRTIAQNITRAVSASVSTPSTTTSSPMGISGLSRLQISHPTAAFIETTGNANLAGNRNKTDMTNLSNISSVKNTPEANAADMEQITVQNIETGASISMLVENPEAADQEEAKDPDDKAEKRKAKTCDTSVDSSVTDIVTESNPKILKATTSSALDKLGKIPLSGSWDGDIATILSSSTDDSGVGNGEKQDDTIDLTEDINEHRSKSKNSESEVIVVRPKANSHRSTKIGQVPTRQVPSAVFSSLEIPAGPTKKRSLLNPSPLAVPVSQALKPIAPIPPAYSKILVPVGTSVPPSGSKFIFAGAPGTTKVPSVGPGSRPTKTIISTPGGKLYGPFNDINDVKMLQVKAPDGTTQPLIKLLPANSLPLVKAAKQLPQAMSVGATKSAVSDPNHNGYPLPKMKTNDISRKTSGHHGTIVNADGSMVETKKQKKQKKPRKSKPSKLDDRSLLKKVRKRKKKPKPSSADVSESAEKLDVSNVHETFDEVDGASWMVQHEPAVPKSSTDTSSKSKVKVVAESKIPVMRRKSVEFQLPSGETFLVTENYNCDDPSGATNSAQLTLSKGQSALRDNITADKENFDGEYSETVSTGHKNTSSDSSQVKKLCHPPAASIGGGDGLRQVRSSSLDSPASEPIKTSTPIPITHKLKVQQGFLPVKRQRSGSDSAAFADASKRIKLVIESPEASISGLKFGSGDCPTKMTPIQKFRERMNIPVIDISDDDSQMSNSSGTSVQGLCSFNQSEDEELDVESVPLRSCVKEDARDILYRNFKETQSEEMEAKGDEIREKKSTRERARRQDILCMFMYLYNTLSNGEETTNEPLSRQKVLDSALETIELERSLKTQLEDELKMENFCHRAHERRLKAVVDNLIKSGVPATVILSHLNQVKHKEEKRLSKKRILQKIIEFGKMQTTEEHAEKIIPLVSSAKPTNKKTSNSTSSRSSTSTASHSQTMLEKLKSNPEMRIDPENPSQYWSENFLIEIEKETEEEDGQWETIGAVEEYQDEITVTVETSYNNEVIIESEPHTSNVEGREVILDSEGREVIQNEEGVELNEDFSQAVTDELSGNSTSMQNSPVHGESDAILRGNDTENNEPEHGTLQRSNSEEAILQVESFIENAENWSRDPEGQVIMATSCDTESKSVDVVSSSDSVEKKEDLAASVTKTKQKDSGESSRPVENMESCSESSGREKSEDRESIFESLLPCEVNFDDASVESVPLESKTPNSVSSNENVSEQTMNVIINDSPREITQTGSTVEEEDDDGATFEKNTDSTNEEKFMICDVRGLAKDEFFCTS